MIRLSHAGFRPVISIFVFILFASVAQAQRSIDWKADTMSKLDAQGTRSTYLNNLRGSGQKATERINLPVDKLKEILDACAAKGITEISVFLVTLRDKDVARYKKNHPESGASDAQIKGSQLVIFRVPRRAFAGAMGAGVNISNHPMMLSLASVGLVAINSKYKGLGFDSTDDIFFDFGTICPPPSSCD